MNGLRYCLAFIEQNTPQSATRLCAIICCAIGGALGLAAVGLTLVLIVLTWRKAAPADVITALAEYVKSIALAAGAFIASGCVALLTRKKATDPGGTP